MHGFKAGGWRQSRALTFSEESALFSAFFSCATPVELDRVVYLRYLPLLPPVKRELYVTVRATRVPHDQPADSLDNEGL